MFKSFKAWGIPMVVLVNADRRIAAIIHPEYLTTRVINEVLEGNTPEVEPARGCTTAKGQKNISGRLLQRREKESRTVSTDRPSTPWDSL